VRHRGRDVAEQDRGVGIPRMRNNFDAMIPYEHRKRTPMGAVRHAASVRWRMVNPVGYVSNIPHSGVPGLGS
jgi:hypothetical protein